MATRGISVQGARDRRATHEGFLRHAGYRWLKVALLAGFVAIVIYFAADVKPRPNGGSWYGYTLGTIGALLILWLTMLGVRKRTMSRKAWSLKGWTSAHVYLGLLLTLIGTLHTGFQFGWNVHTLAYALMIVVIASGVFGIVAYSTLPKALSDNRGETTQPQMLDNLRTLDRQLHEAGQPLDQSYADTVRLSLDDDPFGGGLIARLTGHYPRCGTRRALGRLRDVTRSRPTTAGDPLERVDALLERKLASLGRLRRHLRYKALLEIWLYVHVPLTIALIAALAAHIVSVFFYW